MFSMIFSLLNLEIPNIWHQVVIMAVLSNGTPIESNPEFTYHLRKFCLENELMDSDKEPIFKNESTYDYDLYCVRERFRTLVDAPVADDAKRFPAYLIAWERKAFVLSIIRNIELRLSYEVVDDRAEAYRTMLVELRKCYLIWDLVADAACEHYGIPYKRTALKKLRILIGEEAYYSGNLPCHVPLNRFRELE